MSRLINQVVGVLVSAFCIASTAAVPVVAKPILHSIEFETDQDLRFGKIALTASGGLVRITPSGERYLDGGLENLGGRYGPAIIDIFGEPDQRFLIIAPKFAFIKQRGNRPLRVSRIRSVPRNVVEFDERGHARIKFGGDLRITEHARDGEYRGKVRFFLVKI